MLELAGELRGPGEPRVLGCRGAAFRGHAPLARHLGLGDPGAAEDDDGRFDVARQELELGLEQLELQADQAQLLAQQELDVSEHSP